MVSQGHCGRFRALGLLGLLGLVPLTLSLLKIMKEVYKRRLAIGFYPLQQPGKSAVADTQHRQHWKTNHLRTGLVSASEHILKSNVFGPEPVSRQPFLTMPRIWTLLKNLVPLNINSKLKKISQYQSWQNFLISPNFYFLMYSGVVQLHLPKQQDPYCYPLAEQSQPGKRSQQSTNEFAKLENLTN